MNKKFLVFMFLIFLGLGFVSAEYIISNPKTSSLSFGSFNNYKNDFSNFDQTMCQQGTDFIVQIAPLGCEPTIVRSDLLEEEDVYVFCELEAMKINPLIDVSNIDSISFSGDYPPEVRSIGFYPKYSALGENRKLNNLEKENIGYVVIAIRRTPSENSLLNCEKGLLGTQVCYVAGNLTAKIRYDLKNSFGIRKNNFYLPVLTDSEFDELEGQYSFLNNRGTLRADYVDSDKASIGIYSGRYENNYLKSSSNSDKQKITQFVLREGEISKEFYLPGLECLAGVSFKLEDIDIADTTVRLLINSELIEVREGETFLDGRCEVSRGSLDKIGLNQQVKIKCNEDEGKFLKSKESTLSINPKLVFEIEGEEKIAEVGDLLYASEGKNVYFAYLRNDKNSEKIGNYDLESFETMVLSIPDTEYNENRLTDEMINGAGYLADVFDLSDLENLNYLDFLKVYFFGSPKLIYDRLSSGHIYRKFKFSQKLYLSGKYLEIKDFAEGENFPLNLETKNFYDKALESYDKIIGSFSKEKYPLDSSETLSKESYEKKISLAISLGQKNDAGFFCEDYSKKYPNLYLKDCQRDLFKSGDSLGIGDFLIDGEFKRIELRGIYEPSFEDYGAVIYVKNMDGSFNKQFKIEKNQIIHLNENEFFRLEEINSENQIKINLNLEGVEILGRDLKQASTRDRSAILIKNEAESFGGNYIFTLKEVNLKRVAKVSILTNNKNQQSEVDFPFKVGIEKRAIQLSPNKTVNRIEKLNKTINTLGNISMGLEKSVEVMKTACLATGVSLTVKNLIQGKDGEIIARREVMNGQGGWYERCVDFVEQGDYNDVEQCYLKNADAIDSEVSNLTGTMSSQNQKIKDLQESIGVTKDAWGNKRVNTSRLVEKYSFQVRDNLSILNDPFVNPSNPKDSIDIDKLKKVLTLQGFENRVYGLDDLKEIDLYLDLYSKNPTDKIIAKKLYTSLKQIEVNNDNLFNLAVWSRDSGISSPHVGFLVVGEGSVELPYYGETYSKLDKSIQDSIGLGYQASTSDPVQLIQTSTGNKLIVFLDMSVGKELIPVLKNADGELLVFDGSGNFIEPKDLPLEFQKELIYFKEYDRSNYFNSYKNPEVKYYETEPYEGQPAVVPFDTKNGWYAYIKQTLPAGGNAGVYHGSGVVSSFYICNVGANGIEQFNLESRDDICQFFNLGTGQPYDQFPGLERSESEQLVSLALRAIQDAQNKKDSGSKFVKILGENFEIGSPAVDNSGLSCSDYMSPKDCKILFNVCDPVICPSDRCDFGGRYHVRDVVQSGLIGSTALCLPNAKEGIAVPICLSGVSASVQNYNSVAESYRDCLQTSLDTGENVGVCDHINSIYMCEFVWRQAKPLAKAAVPNILKVLSGENVKGGAEYLRVQSAWENTKESISYFTDFYSVNSYNAFKARSTENVGGEVCKSFVSQVYPSSGGVFDLLTQADSPTQFRASFDEILFTTATYPSTSHYKVNYHIYAGEDQGAYYKIYFRGSPESTYFQDAGSGRIIDSGYIPVGSFASETKDFTAPSGYKELCVVVNNQEECGFKQVSTSFANNYVKDQYIERQVTENQIKTEKECISGSADLYSLTNLNIQEGVGDLISPEIYNRGIIRICSSENPGSESDDYYGTEDQRWLEVGYCGEPSMKCFLDKNSVDDSFVYESNSEKALDNLTQEYYNKLSKQGKYIQENEFDGLVDEILQNNNYTLILDKIENLSKRVFLNEHNAYLKLLQGNTWGILAQLAFDKYKAGLDNKELVGKKNSKSGNIFSGSKGSKSFEEYFLDVDLFKTIYQIEVAYSKDYCLVYDSPVWKWYKLSSFQMDCNKLGKKINSWEGVDAGEGFEYIGEIEFLNLFNEKNSLEGVQVFLENVNLWGDKVIKTDIKTNSVSMDHDKIFTFNYLGGSTLYFRFTEKYGWEYGFDKIIWSDVEDNEDYLGDYKNLLKALETSTEVEGSFLLFNYEIIKDKLEDFVYDSSSNNLLDVLNDLEGKLVPIESCKILDKNVGGEGVAHCFSSLQYIYDKEGVKNGALNCVFSEKNETSFTTDDGTFIIGPTGDKGNSGGAKFVTSSSCYDDKINTENKKLGLLQFGDQVDLIYGGSPHSMIFIEWVDENKNIAKMFDWNGPSVKLGEKSSSGEECTSEFIYSNNKCKTYRFVEKDLSDDKYPVYRIARGDFKQDASFSCTTSFCSVNKQGILDACEDYKDYFISSADKYNVDLNLLVTLAYKESVCEEKAISNKDIGIMQVNTANCGNFGLSSNLIACKNELLKVEKGIEVGAQILNEKYKIYSSGKTYEGACKESKQSTYYKEWDAALRGYNGWGCAKGKGWDNDDYVEEVNYVLNKIGNKEIFV